MRIECAENLVQGRLRRNGKSWPAYLDGRPWMRRAIDDLFMGDELELPRGLRGRLRLRVVLSQGRMFKDACPTVIERRRDATYEITIDAPCPQCADVDAHRIAVVRQATTYCPITWPFERTCVSCGHEWVQTAQFPQRLLEDVLA
jgi:hypothetical protein